MNVSLTNELESWIQSRVETGLYSSASEVVREALRLMVERERLRDAHLAELRGELQIGESQLDADQGIPVDDDFFTSLKRAGRERLGQT